jgi:hypothetical protein
VVVHAEEDIILDVTLGNGTEETAHRKYLLSNYRNSGKSGEESFWMILFYRFSQWLAIDKGAKRIQCFGWFFS